MTRDSRDDPRPAVRFADDDDAPSTAGVDNTTFSDPRPGLRFDDHLDSRALTPAEADLDREPAPVAAEP